MADNLTVKSGSSAPKPGQPGKADETKSREQAELDRLRGIAKKHHGKELDDKTLKAIVARRKAKIAKAQKLDETKQEFQTDQAREKVSSKAADRQTQAQKAMGAKEARGPDKELPAKDAKQVRTNPEAGPKLPPNLAKATTPEQAAQLLDKMFSFVTVDGEAFDQKAYGETIKEKPPTQLKETEGGKQKGTTGKQTAGAKQTAQPQARTGPQPQQQPQAPTRPGETGDPGKKADARAAQTRAATKGAASKGTLPGKTAQSSAAMRSGPPTQTAGPPPGGRPAPGTQSGPSTPGPTPGGPQAMPGQSTSPSLSMSTRGAAASMRTSAPSNSLSGGTGVSSDGLFNAGGGLITNSSFDGMSFNWEAFNWFFTMVVMKDLHKYRREMKELRRLEGKAAIAGMKLKEAITRMRQVFERNKASAEFFESVRGAVGEVRGAIKRAEIDKLLGANQEERIKLDEEMRDVELDIANSNDKIAELEKQLGNLEAGSQEYNDVAAQLAAERENNAELLTKMAGLNDRMDELNNEKGDLERQRESSEGDLGKLADLYAKRGESPEAEAAYQEAVQKYIETIRGLQQHREVMPYMEQRGKELSDELANALEEQRHHQAMVERAEARFLKLRNDVGELTAEQQTELEQITGQLEEHKRALEAAEEEVQHATDKFRIHNATMMAAMSPEDRQETFDDAKKLLEDKKKELQGLRDNGGERSDRRRLRSEIRDLEAAVPILEQAAKPDITPMQIVDFASIQEYPELGPIPENLTGRGLEHALQYRAKHPPGQQMSANDVNNNLRVASELAQNQRQGGILTKAGQMIETFNDKVLKPALDSDGVKAAKAGLEGATDRAIGTSINLDMQARAECNGMLRRHASRSQGMVNQLMQLLRMQRSM